MHASPGPKLVATIIVWALILAIAPGVVVYRIWARNHPVAESVAEAVPWQQIMVMDLSGDLAVYGSRAFGGAVPTNMPTETEDLTPEELAQPEVGLRVAAMRLHADRPDEAAELLAGVVDDPDAVTLASALADGASEEDLEAGLECAARLEPLWVRRVYRLAIAEAARDEFTIQSEAALADAEAPFRVLKVLLVASVMVIVGMLSLPALLAAIGFLTYRAWARPPVTPPTEPLVPEAAGHWSGETAPPDEPSLPEHTVVPTPPARPDSPPWSVAHGFGAVIAFLGASAGIGIGLRAAFPGLTETPLGIFTVYTSAAACAFALAYAFAGPRLWSYAGWGPYSTLRAYGLAVWAFLALPSLIIAVALIQRAVFDELPVSENPALQLAHGVSGWGDRILMLVTLAVAAPLVEETLFRGVLWAPLRPRIGAVGTIVLTSAVFGAMHFDFMVLPQLFLIGVGCAVLRELTGSLKASMILHGLWNGGTYILITLLSA